MHYGLSRHRNKDSAERSFHAFSSFFALCSDGENVDNFYPSRILLALTIAFVCWTLLWSPDARKGLILNHFADLHRMVTGGHGLSPPPESPQVLPFVFRLLLLVRCTM